MKKVDKKTTLEKVLKIKGSKKVLEEYKVPCLSCPFAQLEMGELTIGNICQNYGIDEEGLIKKLNKLLKE
jgi:hypothetical protein